MSEISNNVLDLVDRIKKLEDRNSLLKVQNLLLKKRVKEAPFVPFPDAQLDCMPHAVLRNIFSYVSDEDKDKLMLKSVDGEDNVFIY